MAELIWQQQINKIIKETLTVTADLPEIGRVTSINVFSDVLRGEIYRGSMVVQGNIKCEIYYATKNIINYEEDLEDVELQSNDDLTDLDENYEADDDPYFEDNLPEDELWGAEDLETDLEKEPIYCLVHNLTYRVPVEIPRLEAGQNFEFTPGVEGVKYEIIDPRTIDAEVGLNIDLGIYGEKIEAAPELPEETVVPAPNSELEQALEKAVKEIEEGVEAVLSGICKKVQGDACLDEQISQAVEEIKETVQEIVDEIIEEEQLALEADEAAQNIAEGLTEVVMEELLEDITAVPMEEAEEVTAIEELTDIQEVTAIEELIDMEEVTAIEEVPAIEEVFAIVDAPVIETNYQPPKVVTSNQGTVITFNGTRELEQTVGFQKQKLVPAFRMRFHQGTMEFTAKI